MIRVLRETHDTPHAIADRVTHAGGWNRLGEPNFRVVWGRSRLTWIGGKWTDYDIHGNVVRRVIELRRLPKYLPLDRWHIERWIPPEAFGSPRFWHAFTLEREDGIAIPALGPYPSRGEYEHCFTLQSARGEFVPLGVAACDQVIRAIEWARRTSWRDKRRAIDTRDAKRDRAWDSRADDILDDAVPAFHSQPFVVNL